MNYHGLPAIEEHPIQGGGGGVRVRINLRAKIYIL